MCNKYTWWITNKTSNDTLCSYPLGSCINQQCLCALGYRHDMILIRQRDCLLKTNILPIYHQVLIILTLMCVMYSTYHMRRAQGEPKTLMGAVIISLLCLLSLIVNFMTNNYVVDRATSVIGFLLTASNFVVCYGFLFFLSVPLFKLGRWNVVNLRKLFIRTWIIFRIIHFIPGVISIVVFGDETNPSLDHGYNTIVVCFYLTIGIETVFLTVSLAFGGFRLVNIVQDIIDKAPKGSIRQSTREYVKKTRKFLYSLYFNLPQLIVGYFLIPGLYFVHGYVPYAFIFYILTSSSFIFGSWFTVNALNKSNRSQLQQDGDMTTLNEDNSNIVTSVITGNVVASASSSGRIGEIPQQSQYQSVNRVLSEMTTVQSVTNVNTVSDPVLLKGGDNWKKRGDWVERFDDDGTPCYFNLVTKQWSFDPNEE